MPAENLVKSPPLEIPPQGQVENYAGGRPDELLAKAEKHIVRHPVRVNAASLDSGRVLDRPADGI